LIELSAVGFNADETIAVVFIGYHCGEECRGGEFRALEKKTGKWKLLTGKGLWNHCVWYVRDRRLRILLAPKRGSHLLGAPGLGCEGTG
jgi:hypothetical protein